MTDEEKKEAANLLKRMAKKDPTAELYSFLLGTLEGKSQTDVEESTHGVLSASHKIEKIWTKTESFILIIPVQ